jgi:hypothetical protein
MPARPGPGALESATDSFLTVGVYRKESIFAVMAILWRRLLVIPVAASAMASPLAGQTRPLRTADPDPIPHGRLAVEMGVEWLDEVAFPLSGLEGDLLRAPAVAFRFGLGGLAEFQVAGGHDLLFIDDRRPAPFADMIHVDGDVAHDIYDPVVATKLRLQRETPRLPSMGLRVATRLPSASNKSGLGTDTTDFFMWVLAGKTIVGTRLLANLGLGVLSVPTRGDRQNDVLMYGLAADRPIGERWSVALEVNGRTDRSSGEPPEGTEDMGQARLGARWIAGTIALDGALIVGLHAPEPDVGATVGMSWLMHAIPE